MWAVVADGRMKLDGTTTAIRQLRHRLDKVSQICRPGKHQRDTIGNRIVYALVILELQDILGGHASKKGVRLVTRV